MITITSKEKERIILETKQEVYNKIRLKILDIDEGDIDPDYYVKEIDRILYSIKTKLDNINFVDQEEEELVEGITPGHGPGDTVKYTITDRSILFKVMEVIHKDKTYKLKTKNQIKPVTVVVGWGELDEF